MFSPEATRLVVCLTTGQRNQTERQVVYRESDVELVPQLVFGFIFDGSFNVFESVLTHAMEFWQCQSARSENTHTVNAAASSDGGRGGWIENNHPSHNPLL